MSGHSKWSTIKHKKGATDAKRGKIFSKIIKEITIAARMGGGDLSGNPRLRTVLAAAKAENMPKDNIEKAIKKGTGELEGGMLEEITYEGYGPSGVAVIVETVTDNKNRTVAEVRHLFSKYNGNIGENGCVSWIFEKCGYFAFDRTKYNEDELIEIGLDAGAEEVEDLEDEGIIEVTCPQAVFEAVREAFDKAGKVPINAEITMIPQSTVKLSGKQAASMLNFYEKLEELDDVQDVWANFDIDAAEMEKLVG
jgi:YebC/PmpR family DNA-binding regulatory protein